MRDAEVVEAFIAFKAANGYPGLKIDRRPEKEKDSEIEAVAGPFAIEHTSIDTLPDQRRLSAYLMRMLGDLETTVVTRRHVMVYVHYDAIQPGQDWPAVRGALRQWLETEGQRLGEKLTPVQIVGVPFPIDVWAKTWPGPPRAYVVRYVPPEDDSLPARIKDLCDRKVEKLSKWSPSKTTVLLLENDDIALMNEINFTDAVLEAYPRGRPAGGSWRTNAEAAAGPRRRAARLPARLRARPHLADRRAPGSPRGGWRADSSRRLLRTRCWPRLCLELRGVRHGDDHRGGLPEARHQHALTVEAHASDQVGEPPRRVLARHFPHPHLAVGYVQRLRGVRCGSLNW